MADKTQIEWTDATWNPITGCSVVSAGCKHCYAMKLAGTRLRNHPSRALLTKETAAGPVWTGEVRFNSEWLDQPIRWRRPRKVFVCAHGDLFHDDIPDDWIDRVFAVMALAPQHTFQVLTKRARRMRDYMRAGGRFSDILEIVRNSELGYWAGGDKLPPQSWPLPNVWLGVSVEDQAAADLRIPMLLETPAAVRWISAEPLLGPVDLTDICIKYGSGSEDHFSALFDSDDDEADSIPYIDWIVAGGESGTNARPMHPDWVRSLRDQCAAVGVPFLFKQWGEWLPGRQRGVGPEPDGFDTLPMHQFDAFNFSWKVGKKVAGRLLDYAQHDGYPSAS